MNSAVLESGPKAEHDVATGAEYSGELVDIGYKQELKRQLGLWDVASFMYNEAGYSALLV